MGRQTTREALGLELDSRSFLPAGTVLGDSYRVERVLGAGGFGITYEATDVHLGASVAIKEYFPWEYATRVAPLDVRPYSERVTSVFGWGLSGFLEEARTLAKFRHPGIVRVYRVFEANSTAYMVMEFEQGQSLEAWLKALGRIPDRTEMERIVSPLLDALESLHDLHFIHRDISPDNIILRSDLTPVLLDFGSARKVVAAKTKVLTGLVKQGYSPQEQYSTEGRFQGPWTDCYALGATLYRALTGSPPQEATERGFEDSTVSVEAMFQKDFSQGFLRAIDQCLKVKPSDRPQSISDLRHLMFSPTRDHKAEAVLARVKSKKDIDKTRVLPTVAVSESPPPVASSRSGAVRDEPQQSQVSFSLQFGGYFLALIVSVGLFVVAAAQAATSFTALLLLVFVVGAVLVYLIRKNAQKV